MRIWKSSIFWKVYLINLVIILVLLGSMYFTAKIKLPELARENYQVITESTIPRFKDQVENLIYHMKQLGGAVQSKRVFVTGQPGQFNEELEEIVYISPFVDNALVINEDGYVEGFYPQRFAYLKDAFLGTHDYFREAHRLKQIYFSDVIFSDKGRPMLVVAVPILDDAEQVKRVIALYLPLEENPFLRSIFQSVNVSDGGYVYIVDRNGRIVTHPDEYRIGDKADGNPLVAKMLLDKHKSLHYEKVVNTKGVSMYASAQYLVELGWGIVAQVPEAETYESFHSFQKIVGIVSAIIIIPLSVLSALHAWQIIKPLQRLYQAVDQVAKGDFEQFIEKTDSSEIGRLSTRFNEMIHHIREAKEKIQYQNYHDPLTGLPNRVLFQDRLMVALNHADHKDQMAAVVIVDLDRFKNINDTLGHGIGDLLLQSVAKRIIECAREGDTVSRLGGDEFILVLPDITQVQEVIAVTRHLLATLVNEPFHLADHELFITPSIGIAIYPNDGGDVETLLKNAEMAMYRAKERGRNNYQLHTPAMNIEANERLALENNLRRAIDKNELRVYYQPKVDLSTGQMTGMEALVRWHHSEWGLVPPAKFIPIAEETGLIAQIGRWVLRTACEQNKKWQEMGFPPLRVAVNLSGHQFSSSLIKEVGKVIAETRLHPQWLELEITESMLMQNVEMVIEIIKELKEMGIHISVDDFGTGYSSLSYLEKFPLDSLKIDQSFVRFIENPETDAQIARAIISLAHSLGLKVIAEGIETETQLNFLKSQRCDVGQGYLFSKPIPAEEFEERLGEGSLVR